MRENVWNSLMKQLLKCLFPIGPECVNPVVSVGHSLTSQVQFDTEDIVL